MEFFTSDFTWLLFAYVVGTGFGWWWGLKSNAAKLAEMVIDGLIEDGYLKTRGRGEDMEILKHTEWQDD